MYEILSKLGAGAYGQVYLLQCTKYQYALKVVSEIHVQDDQRRGDILLLKLCHANLVRCLDAFSYGTNLHYVMELCCGGSLQEFLWRRKKLLPQDRILVWFSQIADVIRYLHAMNVMHRDLKPANIFLDEKKNIKVGDLGIARELEFTKEQAKTAIGSTCYMSPELHNGDSYDLKVDIWSLGCCIHEMMTLERTFSAENMMELLHKIMTVTISDIPDLYDRGLQELVYSLLSCDPSHRPDALDILYVLNKISGKPTKSTSPQTEISETFNHVQICKALRAFELQNGIKRSQIVPFKASMEVSESETLVPTESLTDRREVNNFMAKLATESEQWLQNKRKSNYDMNDDSFEQYSLTLSTKSQSVSFGNKKKMAVRDIPERKLKTLELKEGSSHQSGDIVRSMKLLCRGQSGHLSEMMFARVMGHQQSNPECHH